MAQTKQKSTPSKKGGARKDTKAKRAVMRVVRGFIMVLLGVFVFLCMISDSMGAAGKAIGNLLTGLLGNAAYVIPLIFIFLGALLILRETHKGVRVKSAASFFTVVSLSALINNFTTHVGYSGSIAKAASDYFIWGQTGESGGVLGGLISSWLFYGVGVIASSAILIIVLIITLLIITGVTPAAIYRFYKQRQAKQLEREKEDQEEYERRALLQQQKEEQIKKTAALESRKKVNLDIPIDDEDCKKPVALPNNDKQPDKPVLDDKLSAILNKPAQTDKPKEEEQEKTALPQTAKTSTSAYIYPPLTLLKKDTSNENIDVSEELRTNAQKLVDTLKSFGVETKIVAVSRGPSVTRYELSPSVGVKVSKIVGLADDIALNLASSGVRIEAPIPGKAAVGIEVPNRSVSSVFLRDILSSGEFIKSKGNLSFALGKDVSGNVMVGDISKMPHLLIAGATGSGKSVCINTIITSILYKSTPDEVKLLMVDPKVVELGVYNGIPHLLIPVVTDPKKAAGALRWAVSEMLNRYKLFAENNVRDLKGYNDEVRQKNDENLKPLPQVVIIIDELADLMMAAPNEVEDAICRLAQMARAAGMHLVIATQRPSVDVITGVIKANIPSRISFAVSSQVDSRTILDMGGAEKLLGKGDMLYSPLGSNKPVRIQGCFVSDKEVEAVVDFIKQSQQSVDYDKDIIENIEKESIIGTKGQRGAISDEGGNDDDTDDMLSAAIEVVVENEMASVSLLQRRLKLGYARAARIIDQMEERGIVGPYEGSKPRKVLITKNQLIEMKMAKED